MKYNISFQITEDQRQKLKQRTAAAFKINVISKKSVDNEAGISESDLDEIVDISETELEKETTPSLIEDDESLQTTPDETQEPFFEHFDNLSNVTTEDAASATSDPLPLDGSSAKRQAWYRRKRPLTCINQPRIPGKVGEMIAPRCRMGDASIEGAFSSIQYGIHNGRPACLILVDFRLVYQPASTINAAMIEFRFGSDNEHDGSSLISNAFYPHELTGQYETSQEIRAVSPNVGLGAVGCKANVSGVSKQHASVKRRQWRVQGTTEEHSRTYDAFRWKILENTLSEDSVPRQFRTGMIAYLPTPPADGQANFWVDITIGGTLRGFLSRHRVVKEQRWFQPSLEEQQSLCVLSKSGLFDLVQDGNKDIPDLGKTERTIEPVQPLPALPAPAAGASLDVPKSTGGAAQSQQQGDEAAYGGYTSRYEICEVEDDVQIPTQNGDVPVSC